ncbi:MAG: 23S rRNA (uracil(1939)-C(5))-methyltransferase RlmD [Desulfuromonadaceae bacterium]|nr:23S rRNA (uracil(1939)-C(5))-methyltransferase RlmD [Desulfuromonadaceae bacterium]
MRTETLSVVTIEKLAFGGNGVCRINGKVCFVPFSCPGDELSLRITAQKKSYCIASISEVITPSPLRTIPRCNLFGTCGGCNWQHIDYGAQLEQKRAIFAETLWRGGRVPANLIENVTAAPLPYGYRSRLQFKVLACSGGLRLGFFRQGTHQVEDAADGCPVAVPVINQLLGCFRKLLVAYPEVESVSQLSIDAGDNGTIVIIYQSGAVTAQDKDYFAERSGEISSCSGLFLVSETTRQFEKIFGSPELFYAMDSADSQRKPVQLSYLPGCFAQVNQSQNQALLAAVRRLGQFSEHERLLDLYCGNGNFSLPLAAEVASVTGIEGNAESIRSAELNSLFNTCTNARFFCDDVAHGVRRFVAEGRVFDTVLLDPPRAGAGDVVADIARLKPNRCIYVSCDPATLARDCGMFAENGYTVVTSIPVDMFPQTYHIESVTLLSKL